MKTVTCREAGFVVEGQTDDEVMKRGVEHLVKDHGMKEEDITPGMKEKHRFVEVFPLTISLKD